MLKNKRKNMNIIKKIGLSALAGSLVAVSAQAGEVSVTGNLDATYATKSGSSAGAQGKGFSTHTGLTFTGSGEADNGWTFSGFQTILQDNSGISSSQMTIGMGSLGKLGVNKVGGGMVNSLDDKLPTAWEESWDGASHAFVGQLVGSHINGGGISYYLPTISEGGLTIDVGMDYDPAADVAAGGAGSTQTTVTYGSGLGLGVKVGTEYGVSFYAGVEEYERQSKTSALLNDAFNGTAGLTYVYGPVSVGAQTWYSDAGAADGIHYSAEGVSIAFAVNDNLSISYAEIDETEEANIDGTSDVTAKMDNINIAYSMGSMAIKAQHSSTDDQGFVKTATSDRTEVSLSLAF